MNKDGGSIQSVKQAFMSTHDFMPWPSFLIKRKQLSIATGCATFFSLFATSSLFCFQQSAVLLMYYYVLRRKNANTITNVLQYLINNLFFFRIRNYPLFFLHKRFDQFALLQCRPWFEITQWKWLIFHLPNTRNALRSFHHLGWHFSVDIQKK